MVRLVPGQKSSNFPSSITMYVLVTGSSGAIGFAIAELLRRDAHVTGLDLRAGPETTRIGDIADEELVGRLMHGVNAVVHTAALHVPHLAAFGEEEFRRVNVEGTRVLLRAAAAAGVSRFVLTSTTSVYGCSERAGPPATWANESLTPRPSDVYDGPSSRPKSCVGRLPAAG